MNMPFYEARNRPFEKLTKEGIEARIKKVDYFVIPETAVTICSITMENNFSIRGEAASIDPNSFDEELGRQIAYSHAFGQIWAFEAYLHVERRFQSMKTSKT